MVKSYDINQINHIIIIISYSIIVIIIWLNHLKIGYIPNEIAI